MRPPATALPAMQAPRLPTMMSTAPPKPDLPLWDMKKGIISTKPMIPRLAPYTAPVVTLSAARMTTTTSRVERFLILVSTMQHAYIGESEFIGGNVDGFTTPSRCLDLR